MQLSVIIVNYNVKYFLEQCLCSLTRACRNIEAEIWVVDNNSTDNSIAYLQPRFSSVTFISNKANDGFAKANNQALAMATGKYVLFLNPDTIVPEDGLEKCMDFLESHQVAGALGVKMIDGAGKYLKESKRAFPTPATAFYKLTGFSSLFPRSKTFAKYYLGHLKNDKNQEVEVVAGAFMMVPRHVLKITGGFDERFFMYGEDVDLSYRIQQAGYRNVYFAQTEIIHFKGESTSKGSLNHVRQFYKAMSLFVSKHFKGGKPSVFIFFLQIAIGFRAFIAAAAGWTRRILIRRRDERVIRALVVSGAKDMPAITQLLQNSVIPRTLAGRVDIGEVVTEGALGILCELPALIKKYGAGEVIFCVGGIDFRECISISQQLPGGIRIKFHASGSGSIVGSDSSNSNGEAFSDDKQPSALH